MKYIKRTLLFYAITLLFSSQLNAQEYNRVNGAWNAAFIDKKMNDKVDLRVELHLRTIDFVSVWDQKIFRPQLIFKGSKNVQWFAGYSYLRNFNADVMADPRVRTEHNLWEQVLYKTPLTKGSFATWIRLEHRFQEALPLQKDKALRSFDFSSRIRFRVIYDRPLTIPDVKLPTSFVFYNEVFVLMNSKGIPNQFNQNWTFLGLKLELNKQITLNTGFQKNTISKSGGNFLINRLWNTTLFYKL